FTLRQASRRSWRIGQRKLCRVVYLYYQGTMQDRALALMGRKLTAAQALEGHFSTAGLVSMAGEDANIEIALARSLVERMDEGDVRRLWGKISDQNGSNQEQIGIHQASQSVQLSPPCHSLFDLIVDGIEDRRPWVIGGV